VEVDRLAELADDLGAPRVEPDQQPFEQRRVGQVIATRVALDPVFGAHDDQARVDLGAWDRIPSCLERRFEIDGVTADLDRRDP
jgi:hypothetical protein